LTVRASMHFAATPRTSFGVHGCKSQCALRALSVAVLFAALASTPCLAESPNSAAANPAATVSMDHSTFIPSEITVAPGTTVTWVNNGTMPHTVVNQSFRSKFLVKDAKFSFTFTTPGDYDYLCSIHPNMKGKIIVKPGAS